MKSHPGPEKSMLVLHKWICVSFPVPETVFSFLCYLYDSLPSHCQGSLAWDKQAIWVNSVVKAISCSPRMCVLLSCWRVIAAKWLLRWGLYVQAPPSPAPPHHVLSKPLTNSSQWNVGGSDIFSGPCLQIFPCDLPHLLCLCHQKHVLWGHTDGISGWKKSAPYVSESLSHANLSNTGL